MKDLIKEFICQFQHFVVLQKKFCHKIDILIYMYVCNYISTVLKNKYFHHCVWETFYSFKVRCICLKNLVYLIIVFYYLNGEWGWTSDLLMVQTNQFTYQKFLCLFQFLESPSFPGTDCFDINETKTTPLNSNSVNGS